MEHLNLWFAQFSEWILRQYEAVILWIQSIFASIAEHGNGMLKIFSSFIPPAEVIVTPNVMLFLLAAVIFLAITVCKLWDSALNLERLLKGSGEQIRDIRVNVNEHSEAIRNARKS